MKIALVWMTILSAACSTNHQSKYAQGEKQWVEFKIANHCARTTDKKFNDPRPAFRGGAVWGPSAQNYSQWSCNDKIYYSPYGD